AEKWLWRTVKTGVLAMLVAAVYWGGPIAALQLSRMRSWVTRSDERAVSQPPPATTSPPDLVTTVFTHGGTDFRRVRDILERDGSIKDFKWSFPVDPSPSYEIDQEGSLRHERLNTNFSYASRDDFLRLKQLLLASWGPSQS